MKQTTCKKIIKNQKQNCLLVTHLNDTHYLGQLVPITLTREVNLAMLSSAPSTEEMSESGSTFQYTGRNHACFFHALTFAGSLGRRLNTRPLPGPEEVV